MSVIEIINSSFAYKDTGSNNERKVLAIDNLNIRPGEITFIVGVSGAGKSTMLETIGLMNDTFPSDMNKEAMRIYFNLYNSKTGEIERISITNPNIWDDTDENMALRETIRKDNYSFIFQNTNLMPNFSALENVCITDMLNGHCFEEAYMKALLIFKTLGLGDLDITISPQNVSGGQRQRIAFARALIPEYRVLFGDEPTGNLDRKTSYEVMGILHDYIKSTQSGNDSTSTVIVSHDLELAVRYADRI
ncbi:MAG: ABC transporter ATP-binding protein, partial [Bacteroidales bacterium]|nr:ABC transporter ATP-binding protein [Bacteroidales bacterium]